MGMERLFESIRKQKVFFQEGTKQPDTSILEKSERVMTDPCKSTGRKKSHTSLRMVVLQAQNKAVKDTSRLKTGNYASVYKPLQRNDGI